MTDRPTKDTTDTIAAIATPPGEGAIAVVRLSGPASWEVASRLLGPETAPPAPGRFRYATLRDPDNGEILDGGLVLRFAAPHSFTGEDAAELQVHGSPVRVRRILATLLAHGARMAAPGEFTRRAFLNGKLNLTQAEAVIDLIRAKSDRAARLATAQLGNALGRKIDGIYRQAVDLAADVAALLDFPDDELPAAEWDALAERFAAPLAALSELLAGAALGTRLRAGVRVALAGPPNAGKSTLFNALLGSDRAIVSEEPGTTRDLLECGTEIGGVPVRLEDTAGVREASSAVEREGIERARRAAAAADFVVAVLDGAAETTDAERSLLAGLDPSRTLLLLNKADLGRKKSAAEFPGFRCLETSLLPSPPLPRPAPPGAEAVRAALAGWLEAGDGGEDGEEVAVSLRHRRLLEAAGKSMERARDLLAEADEGRLLFAGDAMREALNALAEIMGGSPSEDVLDSIFSHFCIGK